jgi:hypothetical protein
LGEYESEIETDSGINRLSGVNQVSYVLNMFNQRVEQSSRSVGLENDFVPLDPCFGFGDIEGDDEMFTNNFDLDLDLGFRFSTTGVGNNDVDSGFMIPDGGDDFFLSIRDTESESGESESVPGGLRVIDLESDSEVAGNEDSRIDLNVEFDDEASEQLQWESFQLEDHRDSNLQFEWEEIEGDGEERELLSMFFDADADEDEPNPILIASADESVERTVPASGNLEWEVLLNIHNLEANPGIDEDDIDPYFGDHIEQDYPEYEMMFGQFTENENALIGRPPASKVYVENLESVVLTKEDLCAVCKDEMNVGERTKQLPCDHCYHGECIVPWLGIRNTCPVCRYELPTDDPDYERRRVQRSDASRGR